MEDDRVFILAPELSRFIPQEDEEVIGPANTMYLRKDYNNPTNPYPPTPESLEYCSECELTWLVGKEGTDSAARHPIHATLPPYPSTRRSLVVHIDGACADNGQPTASAGMGIYFGPGSSYNVSTPDAPDDASVNATSQKAELWACIHAMRITRHQIVQKRKSLVNNNIDYKQFRLIIVSDSKYLVEGMCSHFREWKIERRQNKEMLVNKYGHIVENSKEFLRLKKEVHELSLVGVQVVYWHVSREFNAAADTLAKAGTRRSFA